MPDKALLVSTAFLWGILRNPQRGLLSSATSLCSALSRNVKQSPTFFLRGDGKGRVDKQCWSWIAAVPQSSFSFPAWHICKTGGAGRGVPLLCWHLNRTDGCILLQEFCVIEGIPSDGKYFLQLSFCTLSLCTEINCSEDLCACAF